MSCAQRVFLFLCAAVAAVATGCAPVFKETYYVGVTDKTGDAVTQLYRFQMEGRTDFGSKIKFESGWFSARALEAIVGENRSAPAERKPAKPAPDGTSDKPTASAAATTAPGVAPGDSPENEDEQHVIVIGPEGEGVLLHNQRLVILMATDPSPITSSIQAFAQQLDQQVTSALVAERQRASKAAADRAERRRRQTQNALLGLQTVLSTTNTLRTSPEEHLSLDAAINGIEEMRKALDAEQKKAKEGQ